MPSAVKVSERTKSHANERDCYLRLRGVGVLCGFRVPRLIDYDDDLLIVEIDIIEGPCILDFGKAYIDCKPPFDPEQLAEYDAAQEELFGNDNRRVRLLQAALRGYGIHYLDAKPTNIILKPGPIIQAR